MTFDHACDTLHVDGDSECEYTTPIQMHQYHQKFKVTHSGAMGVTASMPSPADVPRVSTAEDPAPTIIDDEEDEEGETVDDVDGAGSFSSCTIEGKEDLRRCGINFVVR